MKKKNLYILGAVIVVIALLYFLGPQPSTPYYSTSLPKIPTTPDSIVHYLNTHEKSLPVKAGNEAEVIWANDTLRQTTEYVLVYLHGFSASKEEGNPIHKNIASKFKCNLLLTRLSDHGLEDDEPLQDFTAERLWNSAIENLAIAKQLGKKVILMGTSTGGTLALKLAAEFPDIEALILYSPNIAINDPLAGLLNNPWGLQLAQTVFRSNYKTEKLTPVQAKYWNERYRLESITELQELIETTMTAELFGRVQQPVLLLYYYKDDENQDPIVKVDALLSMFDELQTPPSQKVSKAIPNAGAHVICSRLTSKDLKSVEKITTDFLNQVVEVPFSE